MQAYLKRRVVYGIGFVFSVFGILSVLIDAAWVRVVMNTIKGGYYTHDLNRDGKDDYFETWEGFNLILQEWDMNYDGPVDFRNRIAGEGTDLQDTQAEYTLELDADFDGYFEYREHWDGNDLIRAELDGDKDGTFEAIDVPKPKPRAPNPADR